MTIFYLLLTIALWLVSIYSKRLAQFSEGFVDALAMTHRCDNHEQYPILDLIDDAIVGLGQAFLLDWRICKCYNCMLKLGRHHYRAVIYK